MRSAQSPAETGLAAEGGVASNTVLAFLAQLVTAGLTAFLTLYLTRALGPGAFGRFSLAVSVVGVLLVLADGGVAASASRFIAEHRSDGATGSRILGDALTIKLASGIVVSGLLFGLAAPVAGVFGDHLLTWPLRGVAIALLGQSIMMLYSNALVSVQRNGANLALYATESITETVASVALVLLGGGAAGAAFGRAVGYIVGALASVLLASRVFQRRALTPKVPDRRLSGEMMRYAGVLFIVSGAWTLFSQIDILLIGVFVGSAQVGFFSAPLRLCTVLHYPGLAVQNSVAPRLARRPGHAPDVRSFMTSLRWLTVLQAAMVAPALVWATPIIHLLLGPDFAESAPVLRALTPFLFFQGLGPLVSVGVNFLGESRHRIGIAIGAFLVDLALDVILIPRIGALGGAIATSVAYAMYVPAHLLICRRLLGISLRPFVITCVRALLASAGAAGILGLAGTGELSPLRWIAGAIGASAAFLAVLVFTGELTFEEVALATRTVRARFTPQR